MPRSPYISPNSLFDRVPGYGNHDIGDESDDYLDSDNRYLAAKNEDADDLPFLED